jgi:hypothetical protein
MMVLSVFRAIMVGLAIYLILSYLFKLKIAKYFNTTVSISLVAIVLISTFASSYPISNNFDRLMSPTKINENYLETYRFFEENNLTNSKIVVYPKYRVRSDWNYKKDVFMFDDLFFKNKNLLVWEGGVVQPSYTMVRRSPTLFSKIGVQYIIVNKNVSKIGYDIEEDLDLQRNITKLYTNRDFSVYEITCLSRNDIFRIDSGILVLDDTLDAIDMIENVIHINLPILLTDSIPLEYANELFQWNYSYVLTRDKPSIEYEVRNIIKNRVDTLRIKPYVYVEYTNPLNGWAKGFTFYENYDKVLRRSEVFDYSQDHLYGVAYATKKGAILKIPLNLKVEGNYRLYVRYLQSSAGDVMKINNITIETFSSNEGYRWIEIPCYLNKNDVIVLQNIQGLNAVNLLILIPEKKYEKSKTETGDFFQNKTSIYLLGIKKDLYDYNAKVDILNNGSYRFTIKAKGDFGVQMGDEKFEFHNSNLTYWYSPIFELNEGKYNLTITTLNNPVANFSFEPVSNTFENVIIAELPEGVVSFSTDSYSGNSSLKVSSNVTEEGLLWLYTPEVNVTLGERYSAITHMKYKNVVESHISIEGYNKTAGEWIELMQVPSGQTGTSDWEEYKQILTIPEDITKIRFVLNAGWIKDPSDGNAATWFDDIGIYPVKDFLDVVWLYSTKNNNETLNELFKTNETPASIINYTKIDPTKYKVKVKAKKPFMLSFAESYDPLWEARVYKDGVKVEVAKSIPMYSVINGFWIDETGNLEIEIRYKPQDWFVLGLWVSVTTFIGCIGYLFYDWRRGKGGKWALRIGARRHNAGNVVNKGFREGVQRRRKK